MQREYRRCSNCRFVRVNKRQNDGAAWRECIKNAPIASQEDGAAWWPSVNPDDTCWEWSVEEDRLEAIVESDYYQEKQLSEGKLGGAGG